VSLNPVKLIMKINYHNFPQMFLGVPGWFPGSKKEQAYSPVLVCSLGVDFFMSLLPVPFVIILIGFVYTGHHSASPGAAMRALSNSVLISLPPNHFCNAISLTPT
jgi:hypothetical protein